MCPYCGHKQGKEIRASLANYVFKCIKCGKSRKIRQKGCYGLQVKILFQSDNPRDIPQAVTFLTGKHKGKQLKLWDEDGD